MKKDGFEKQLEFAREAGAHKGLLGFISENIGKGCNLELDYIKKTIDDHLKVNHKLRVKDD